MNMNIMVETVTMILSDKFFMIENFDFKVEYWFERDQASRG